MIQQFQASGRGRVAARAQRDISTIELCCWLTRFTPNGVIPMDKNLFFEKVRAGDTAAVAEMLRREPGLAQAVNELGVSAILMACYTGRKEIRDLLLEHSAQLELHEAVTAGQLEKVQDLVEKDARTAKACSPDGFPLVALAAAFG